MTTAMAYLQGKKIPKKMAWSRSYGLFQSDFGLSGRYIERFLRVTGHRYYCGTAKTMNSLLTKLCTPLGYHKGKL